MKIDDFDLARDCPLEATSTLPDPFARDCPLEATLDEH
jgi:hypothetical protein